ncbi:hypothetical protein PI124_g18540 [Phytophthora idaei]|nr:hypothetical protein PI125_g21567 [Phytophthora idaei]KAG3136337.1 hypothetical protein PI126_g17859 [Phytophthora idaei]KAG3236448.1 hypothetical protein PI124_g18540 [Phytophthora idaei]
MKHRSWIKAIAASALASPRAAFRKTNTSLGATDAASLAPPIPLAMLATLTRVVQFLDKNHLEEEGLYSKPGVGLERKELLRLCRCNQLPDLSMYSPHSIARVVKEILGELYEPLISADISQQLLDAVSAGHMDGKTENTVTEIFKQIPFSTREFLQVFLGHLHTIAASGSSHMSVANLALNVGIALVRPPGDKTTLNSKTMIRRRKCIAEFFIRQAPSLPYDCATEMNIPAIPEEISTSTIDTADSTSTKKLHFVQVTWDIGESSLTVEQLEEIFSKFGQIENLGINDLGNRAIIAYADAAGAVAAERASMHALRVRRRKPRQGEKRREFSPHSSERSRPPSNLLSLHDDARASETVMTPKSNESAPTQDKLEPENKDGVQTGPRLVKANPIDDTIIVEDIEDDQLEINSSDPTRAKEEVSHMIATEQIDPEADEHSPSEKLPQSSDPDESSARNYSSAVREMPLIDEAKQTTERQGSFDKDLDAYPGLVTIRIESQNELSDSNPKTLPPQAPSLDELLAEKPSFTAKTSPQTPSEIPAVEDELTTDETLEITQKDENLLAEEAEFVEPRRDDCMALNSSKYDASIEELHSRLLDMEKILSTSTSALSATKLANEFERAVLQLHKQILDMVAECLIFAGLRHGEVSGNSMGTTNAEFLDFLEAQSKTQVKILEVEVRAGQELLRLHKTQYEKERVELEEEMTTLRVGRTETERLCAELRTDLRKCRSELACHVANATDIQRQKSVLEEKLASSEDKLHAKEVALLKLQAEYDKMHRVAAEAQMRVEKLKQSDIEESKGFCNQVDHRAALPEASKVLTSARDLPHTPKLFSKLSKQSTDRIVEEEPVPQAEAKIDTSTNSSRSSNVAALEAMKQQMARDIQEQIAATRAALKEMEICSSSGKTLQEEEEELRQLQQQLAARSAEMDTAMTESRTKLKELLDPAAASSFHDDLAVFDEMKSNQEPTIFDSTALVNELIARTERTPAAKSTQCADSFSSNAALQSPFGSQQLAQYHRPAQSVLYKKWTADRSRKMAQLANYRDQQAVLRAQQSMQTFQQALAQVREKR